MKVRGLFQIRKGCRPACNLFRVVAALLVSCEKNSEIKVYRVSKAPLEQSAPQQQDAMPTNTAAPRMPGGLRAGGGNRGDDTAELGSAAALANAAGKFSGQRR